MTTQTLLRMSNKDFHAHCAEVYEAIEYLERPIPKSDARTNDLFPALAARQQKYREARLEAARRLRIWIKKIIIAKYNP